MPLPRMLLSILPILAACGSPSGPSQPLPPTGVIYFEYRVPGSAFPAA
ncbi:MAG TPA: hypothetical protein VFN22_02215 [Gemmatimonadales bacterium]|nr:hypothetical protein [Gemmatimonadales bacterium]